jgi:hypothetical protein
MILITFSFLICWGPNILQSVLTNLYKDFHITNKLFENFYDGESTEILGALVSNVLYFVSILNSLGDPLIFFFRMRIVRESAFAMFKLIKSTGMTSSTQLSVATEVSSL